MQNKSETTYVVRRGLWTYVKHVTGEIYENRRRIWNLARFEKKARQGGTVLGSTWNLLNPALQIFVYWFVFSVGLRMSSMKGDMPYSVWMMSGILPWFFINGSMMRSTSSIVSAGSMLRNIRFPLAAVPAKAVVMDWIDHLWTLAILLPVIVLLGVPLSFNMLWTVYYMAACVCFLMAFAILASAINAVFRDFSQILLPVLRLLMYVSSVIWSIDSLGPNLQVVMRLNPLTYIIEGYRAALLYHGTPFAEPWRGLYFWTFTAAMYVLGCLVHCHLRDRFIDVI